MALRYRPSDNTRAGRGGCVACADVQADVIRGELRLQSLLGRFPGQGDWPLLGCIYASRDSGDGPFGQSRTAAGMLGMKVLGTDTTSNCNVVNEQGGYAYYVYAFGVYEDTTGYRNNLYGTAASGWVERRDTGNYFEYDSNKRLISAYDVYGNALYFAYDGNGHHQQVQSHETGRVAYFETDGSGRITSVKDWGNREATLSYDGNGNLNKVVGPSLCVTYFDYDANDDLVSMTDPEGRTVYYGYDTAHRIADETYDGHITYFEYPGGTYSPNDLDCDGWYGRDSSPPNNLATWQGNHYTASQLDTVSADNSSYVEHCNQPPPPSFSYAGHEYLFEIFEDRDDVTQIDVEAKIHVYYYGLFHKLYVWNFNSTSWTQLDAESPWTYSGSAYVGTLSGSVTSSITNYIDTNGHIYALACSFEAPGCVRVAYAEVTITT